MNGVGTHLALARAPWVRGWWWVVLGVGLSVFVFMCVWGVVPGA